MTEKQRQDALKKLERLEQACNSLYDGKLDHTKQEAEEMDVALDQVRASCAVLAGRLDKSPEEQQELAKALDEGWGY